MADRNRDSVALNETHSPCTDFVIPRRTCSGAGTGAELCGDKAGIGDEAAPDAAGGGYRDEALRLELDLKLDLQLAQIARSLRADRSKPCSVRRPISAFATSPHSGGRSALPCRRYSAAPWRGRRHP